MDEKKPKILVYQDGQNFWGTVQGELVARGPYNLVSDVDYRNAIRNRQWFIEKYTEYYILEDGDIIL